MIGPNYLINLDSRPDRLASVTTEFKRVGLAFERFPAHTGEVPYLAFNSSQYNCILKAFVHEWEHFTIYEDDVRFGPYSHATEAINELPPDWGILQMGCNLIGSDVVEFKQPERYSAHLFRLYDCWQTQSVAYSREAARWILHNWDYKQGHTYDDWLRQVYKIFPCFVVAPQLTYQDSGFSDIWGVNVDTKHLFEQGNNLLK